MIEGEQEALQRRLNEILAEQAVRLNDLDKEIGPGATHVINGLANFVALFEELAPFVALRLGPGAVRGIADSVSEVLRGCALLTEIETNYLAPILFELKRARQIPVDVEGPAAPRIDPSKLN